jgi:plasmid stabilization system protein ParE
MKYRIVPSSDAEADVISASWWYRRIAPNLAARFVAEGRATLRRIAQFPSRFPLVNGSVRRALLTRFPYAIYYSLNYDEVFLIAVLHQRRSDSIWKQRSHDPG